MMNSPFLKYRLYQLCNFTRKSRIFAKREMPGTLPNYLWDGHLSVHGCIGFLSKTSPRRRGSCTISHSKRTNGGTVARWHEVLLPGLRSVAVQTHHLMNLRKPWKELGVLVGIGRRLHHVSGLLYAKKNLMTRLGKKQPHDIDATKWCKCSVPWTIKLLQAAVVNNYEGEPRLWRGTTGPIEFIISRCFFPSRMGLNHFGP